MSRIHEALKKAEQEQSLRSASMIISEPLATGGSFLNDPELPIQECRQFSVQTEVLFDAGWLSKLPMRQWETDHEKVIFADSSHHYEAGMEEFRTLRSRLYQLREKEPIHRVIIASALPGEGKTFVSSNLGFALVRQHGRRVLIIDADIRKPHLHECLGAPDSPGLNEYLAGKADETAILQRGPSENLFFIPGGQPVSNPSELIANGRFKQLLENIGPSFDWVLMDSPPIVPIADATVIAGCADGVVLVVRAEQTPIEMVQKAKQELKGTRLLGVVLNRIVEQTGYSSYYYSYGQTTKD